MLKKFAVLLSIFTLAALAAEPAAENIPAASVNFKRLIIPVLKPVGSGELTDSVRQYVLRGEHVIYFCAKEGEVLTVNVKHFGNKQKPLSAGYVFLDRRKNVLQKGVIVNGSSTTLSCKVDKADTYALLINSGHGAVPWYAVSTKNPFAALASTTKEIYLFSQQTIYAPGKTMNNAEIQIRTTPNESFAYSIDGAPKVDMITPKLVKLPLPEKNSVKIQLTRIPGKWCQNFLISFPGGRTPFLFFGPNRAVDIVR